MRDPDAGDREYDPDQYWRNPGTFEEKGLTSAFWNDPWPGLQGMLTSEHIRRYHETVGRMIRPFDPDLLKPASYELTLGASCLVEGEPVTLTDDDPVLRIPPNSVAYVSMQQVVFMPHYLVGRFDLAIDFIYRGLLLGTGPQVDPGFMGALSCPLHNISNDEIEIRLGKPFAKLDFAKTAPRPREIRDAWRDLKTDQELAGWLKENADEYPFMRLFKAGTEPWRRPIYGYLEGRRPTSSVGKLRDDVETSTSALRDEFGGLRRNLNFALVGLIVTLLLGVPAFVFGAVDGRTDQLATKEQITEIEHTAAERKTTLDANVLLIKGLQTRLAKAEQKVCKLERPKRRGMC